MRFYIKKKKQKINNRLPFIHVHVIISAPGEFKKKNWHICIRNICSTLDSSQQVISKQVLTIQDA